MQVNEEKNPSIPSLRFVKSPEVEPWRAANDAKLIQLQEEIITSLVAALKGLERHAFLLPTANQMQIESALELAERSQQ